MTLAENCGCTGGWAILGIPETKQVLRAPEATQVTLGTADAILALKTPEVFQAAKTSLETIY